jgi:hypothetical protein
MHERGGGRKREWDRGVRDTLRDWRCRSSRAVVIETSLLISHEGMHFLSRNSCLKKCLGESAQFKIRLQFGRTHQPVRTNPRLSFNTTN